MSATLTRLSPCCQQHSARRLGKRCLGLAGGYGAEGSVTRFATTPFDIRQRQPAVCQLDVISLTDQPQARAQVTTYVGVSGSPTTKRLPPSDGNSAVMCPPCSSTI